MKGNVVRHEARNKEIAVVIAFLHPQGCRLTLGCDCLCQCFGFQQIKELIRRALINQDMVRINSLIC